MSEAQAEARRGRMELGDEAKSVFDQALVDSTIAALDALGPTVKESIFLLLQRRNSISPDQIPKLVAEFVKALQDVLGPTSRVVEKLIIAGLIARKQVPANLAQGRRLLEVVGSVRLAKSVNHDPNPESSGVMVS